MEYIEAIATLIVLIIVPAVIVCAIVGAPESRRRPTGSVAQPPDRPAGSHQ